MERNFDNREFEQYVKRNADQYRMIPSEKVWKGINASLHTRRKWYGFGLTLLLLLTAVSVTWVMFSYPVSKKQEAVSDEKTRTPLQTNPLDNSRASVPVASKNISNILSYNKFNEQGNIPGHDNPVNETVTATNETNSAEMQIASIKTNEPGSSQQTDKSSEVASRKGVSSPVTVYAINSISQPVDISMSDKKAPEDKFMRLSENKPVKNIPAYYPLNIESVKNTHPAKKFIKRLKWQLYFAPTVSYRKLSANKSYSGNVSPFSAANYPFASLRDVNSEVVHKPDMGLELGLLTKYPITKNLKLTGGFQFNINRYDIKAFAYYGEQATINLNGGSGNNSVTAWTYYRNYNGYKSDWLKNYYFSVSAPFGAELRLIGNDKTYIGIAGTIQPTYILKDRAFLISSDYKNYVEIPSFIRHLNVNTSMETYISYTSRNAKTRWQIGPQVRYQVLSSFKNKYPVKENLFDFGLKVGVSRNK